MALEAWAEKRNAKKKKKGRKREDRGFQAAVLGGTFAAVPGTQLLGGEGAVFSC